MSVSSTRNADTIRDVIEQILCVDAAITLDNLFECIKRLPVATSIKYDKIYGRWIFCTANFYDEDLPMGHTVELCYGPNFCFIDRVAEMAIGRGLHYYFNLNKVSICQ